MNRRTRLLKNAPVRKGPVVYWMSRDQRIHDNWAVVSAMEYASENRLPLIIVFNLADNFLNASARHYGFMLKGLAEVYGTAAGYNIPFIILEGEPAENIPCFLKEYLQKLFYGF
jgi:deoxyribodipyrimidine photo-lyase